MKLNLTCQFICGKRYDNEGKQAGAELCQAQASLCYLSTVETSNEQVMKQAEAEVVPSSS